MKRFKVVSICGVGVMFLSILLLINLKVVGAQTGNGNGNSGGENTNSDPTPVTVACTSNSAGGAWTCSRAVVVGDHMGLSVYGGVCHANVTQVTSPTVVTVNVTETAVNGTNCSIPLGTHALTLTAPTVTCPDDVLSDKANPPAGTEWFFNNVYELAQLGVAKACQPDTNLAFRPGDPISRAEAAGMLLRVWYRDANHVAPAATSASVTCPDDVLSDKANPPAGTEWFFNNVYELAQLGIAKACQPDTNLAFRPGDNISRAEFAGMLLRAWHLDANHSAPSAAAAVVTCPDDVLSDKASPPAGTEWFFNNVYELTDLAIAKACQTGTSVAFRPGDNITRAEAAGMLLRVWHHDANHAAPSPL
ncbi:MAG: S-layer homology domain-containing protein [Patescibacteria group bacterium]|nr:S-layer homology domain-containing protein [Patescibacteria group bacterium]